MTADARVVLDHLPIAVGVVDANGTVEYVNTAAAALIGLDVDDIVGRPAAAVGVATSDAATAGELMTKIAAGEPWIGTFPMTRADGERRRGWFTVAPIEDGGGAYAGMIVAGADVQCLAASLGLDAGTSTPVDGADVEAEVEAEQANLLLATLLDTVPVGMVFFDRAARVVRVNRGFSALTGLPADEHLGRHVADVFGGMVPDVAEDIAHVFGTGETIDERTVSGDAREWLVSYYPVRVRGEVVWVGATIVELSERTRLLERERAARRSAEQAAQQLARLQVITGNLAEATTIERVASVVAEQGTAGVAALNAALMTVTPAGDAMRIVAAAGFDAATLDRFVEFPLDADLPAARAARTLQPVFLASLAERDREFPAVAGAPASARAFAILPLVMKGRALGAVAFGWADERTFEPSERDFLLALARQASLALERVRLYEAERTARATAEEARERMAFLAEASRVLASSLDYNETLRRLARLAVPEVADACTVHLVVGRDLSLVVAAHSDPAKQRVIESLSSRPPAPGRPPVLLGRVVLTATAVVLPEVPHSLWQEMAEDAAHLDALRSLGLRSAVAVPLVSSGRVLGVLTLGALETSRSFTSDDLPFVEDLASRAAVAIENSRAHEARSEVARTLQQSLLPPHLPHIAGLELASRYHSAGEVDVGGDFYDVFPSGDGRWGVVMGDVCGKGIAAASLTALARYTVRAGAIDEGEPTQVLHLLNRAILEADTDDRFCTITYAIVEPDVGGGRAHVRLACGGHPLPLLVRPDGIVREIGTPGTAIGLFEELDLAEVDVELGPGEALVFYTDGFVEVRSPDGRFAPGLLRAALAAAAGVSAARLAEAVDRAVLAFEGGQPRDDMALLILRVPDTAAG